MQNYNTISNGEAIPFDEAAEGLVIGAIFHGSTVPAITRRHIHSELYRPVFERCEQLKADGEIITAEAIRDTVPAPLWPQVSALADAYIGPDGAPKTTDLVAAVRKLHDTLFERQIFFAQQQPNPIKRRAAIRAALEEHDRNTRSEDARDADVRTFLARCAFDPTKRPPPLRSVYDLDGVTICTPGNLTAITAHVKAGKSAFIGAMLAAAMTTDRDADTLSLSSGNPNGLALIHFDTEQSYDDYWHLIDRAMQRARVVTKPDWLLSYRTTGSTAAENREALRVACREAKERFGGALAVILDGSADFVVDVNDQKECNPFVASLHGLAGELDAPIVCVIHFNPKSAKSTGEDKTRGHLGSQLERKSETNLVLDKDKATEVTTVWSTKQRRAPILKDQGPAFKFSEEHGMHMSCAAPANAKAAAKTEKHRVEVDSVFHGRGGLRYIDVVTAIQKTLKVCRNTAETRFTDYNKAGLIHKHVADLWEKTGQ